MKRLLSVLVLLALLSPVLRAEEPDSAAPRKERPKVGLVLSGGGAKGLAHIGALKIIEESGIPIDIVVGTSIGSIVGGIYALGYSAADMDSLVRAQDWNLLIRDQMDRRDISYMSKEDRDRYLLSVPFMNAFNFNDETQANKGRSRSLLRNMPGALVEGQNLDQLFTKLSVGYQDDIDFNDLPIPFACVAVDLNTKDEYVFHHGSIVTAIRSSMSIPAYFTPVRVGDKFLVDGGMVNNLPVDVARQMGADYIITIDLHNFKKPRTETDQTLPEQIGTMLSMMNGEKYQAARQNSDIIIEPNTSEYGVLAFDNNSVVALIDSGQVAARLVAPKLKALADHLKEFPDTKRVRPHKATNLAQEPVLISQIEISGADPKEMKWLLSKTDIAPGEMVSGETMDKMMKFFYNTRAFTKVFYRVCGTGEDGYQLRIFFEPQRLHQAAVGLRFDTEEMASILLGVSFNKRKLFGSKLDIEAELGANINGTLNYGYTFRNRTQLNVSAHLHHLSMDVYDDISVYEENPQKYEYGLDHTERYNFFRGDVNYQIIGWRSSDIRIGAQYDNMEYRTQSAVNNLDEYFLTQTVKAFASWRFDSLDDNYFPTRGLKMGLEGGYYNIWDKYLYAQTGNDVYFKHQSFEAMFDLKATIPLGSRVALIPQTWNRILFGSPGGFYRNFVGGTMYGRYTTTQLPFIGLNHTYSTYDKVDIARADLRFNLFKQHYVTLHANYMLEWDLDPSGFMCNHHYGFGASYAVNTFIGPVQLLVQYSDISRRVGVYFALGFDF